MAFVDVITPGLLTTVQDAGRWGWQSQGVSVAGPMDSWSHRLANRLVGNAADAATIELTLVSPELQFEDERTIAVAGADVPLTVNGQGRPLHTPLVVGGGALLRFGRCRAGARAYLSIAGGIDVPPVLGSRATHIPSGMGGFEGRAL